MLPPLDDLARRLARHGIPRRQIHRYLEELRDHRQDLILELEQTGTPAQDIPRLADQRLGDSEILAQSLIAAHRRRSFMGRHPIFFFAILPVIAVPLTLIIVTLTMVIGAIAVVQGFDMQSLPKSAHYWQAIWIAGQAANYISPGLLGILIYRAAWRRGLGWKWRAIACASAIAWGAWLRCYIRLGDETRQGMITLGSPAIPSPTQALVAIAWIALWAWYLDRRARRINGINLETSSIPDGTIT